jgi:hypothetical protein
MPADIVQKRVEEPEVDNVMPPCCAEMAAGVRVGHPTFFKCVVCSRCWIIVNNGALMRDLVWAALDDSKYEELALIHGEWVP